MPKQPYIVNAVRWWKNGDHPQDDPTRGGTTQNGEYWEGKVVRYYRHPDVPGDAVCNICDHSANVHGWLDPHAGGDGQKVCPGDWILDALDGSHHVCKVDLTPICPDTNEPDPPMDTVPANTKRNNEQEKSSAGPGP